MKFLLLFFAGIALIQFVNKSTESADAYINDRKYIVAPKETKKVFAPAGIYKCRWHSREPIVYDLQPGDIILIEINAKPKEPKPKIIEEPKIVEKSKPEEKPVELPKRKKKEPSKEEIKKEIVELPVAEPKIAIIQVIIPLEAKRLWFDTDLKKLESGKQVYIYRTPELVVGEVYFYQITVGIRDRLKRKTIRFKRGDVIRADFTE